MALGDVEVGQVRAAEGAAGDARGGQADDTVEGTRGRVAAHRPAVVERDPQAALGVDGHAVRQPCRLLEADERPPIECCAAGQVEVEDVDPVCGTVDVVHELIVSTPVDAVRDRGGTGDDSHRAVGADAVEGTGVRPGVECHRAAPEAADPVHFDIVEPGVRIVRLDGHQASQDSSSESVSQTPSCRQRARPPADRGRTAPTIWSKVRCHVLPSAGSSRQTRRPAMSTQSSDWSLSSQDGPSPIWSWASTANSHSAASGMPGSLTAPRRAGSQHLGLFHAQALRACRELHVVPVSHDLPGTRAGRHHEAVGSESGGGASCRSGWPARGSSRSTPPAVDPAAPPAPRRVDRGPGCRASASCWSGPAAPCPPGAAPAGAGTSH